MYIAMFFAYTNYDSKEDRYYPIEDFKDLSPTLYVANIVDIYKEFKKSFKIVGFQAILRPRLQHAMALDANNLSLKSKFKAIPLPKEPIIAKEIFNQFRGGKTIFPKDYIAFCANIIKNSKELKEDYVMEYCHTNKLDCSEVKKQLQQQGYKFTGIEFRATEHDTYMMNRELDDYIIPTLNEYIAVYPIATNLRFTIYGN